MKNRILLILLLLFIFQTITTAQSNFKLEISTDKYNYSALEDIMATVKITNISNEFDSIANAIYDGIKTIDENGELGECNFSVEFVASEKFIKLYPNEYKIYNINIRDYYGRILTSLVRYFAKGTYGLFCRIKDKRLYYINSDTIKFSVEGVPKEEMDLYTEEVLPIESIVRKPEIELCDTLRGNLEKLVELSRKFLYKNPKSIFTRFIWYYCNGIREKEKYKYDETFLEDTKYFIENCNFSKFTLTLLFDCVSYFSYNNKGKEGLEYLDYLKNKYNNPLLNAFINDECVKILKQ